MPTRTKSKAPIKGRVMYAIDHTTLNAISYQQNEVYDVPVFVLPLTAPDGTPVYEELVDRVAKAISRHLGEPSRKGGWHWKKWRDEAAVALAAINATPKGTDHA